MKRLNLVDSPSLKNPLTIMGFGGWADAGNVSTMSLAYLRESENAANLGFIDVSDLVDHTYHRPIVSIEGGFIKELAMPSFEIHYSVRRDRDLILVSGYELSHGWQEFAASLFELMDLFGSKTLTTIGGLIDNTPHTKPVRITFLTTSRKIYAKAMAEGLRPSNYTGPASMHSYILKRSGERGVEAFSIWGHVPSYLNTPNPRVVLAVLEKLSSMLETTFRLERLYVEATVFDSKVNTFVESDERLKEMVRKLEAEYEESERRPFYIS
ncbi:MAG: PAC2 family protein [Candidatus Caldarchaeum sp.]|nr:PAC2 family protein [Candidatus Caldarchaeum sp.]MDW8360446.1 PAC2 family protein [Candidatus Caldarchaeum sp.]